MADDGRLSIQVEHADGRTTRWSASEVDGRNIPGDLTFGTVIPGGYGTVSCSLLRRLDQDYPDQDLFDNVTVYGPGGRVAYDGRMAQFPRSHGASYSINPGGVGWSAHLRDNPSFREIYVDRDLGSWVDMPLAEKVRAVTASQDIASIGWQREQALVCALPNQALGAQVIAELWYLAPAGVKIAGIEYVGSRTNFPAGYMAAQFRLTDSDALGGDTTYTNTLDGTLRGHTMSTAARNACILVFSNGTAATPASGASERYTTLAVSGAHGLPSHPITGEPNGLHASDVVAHVVSRAAPLLTYTTGAGGSIEPTVFAIPHAVYRDPVTAEFVVSDVNKYHLYDWGVWEGREFFFRQPDPDRCCWEARLGDGADMGADGLTAEPAINGVFVTYTDPTGRQFTVGPPGGRFDATDAALADTSAANPVNSHGIPAKWDNLALSFPTTQAGATQIGAVYLAERALATRRGSLKLTGTVQHPTEGRVPVWRVRAGDWVRVTDLNGENATVQRKIIETSYTHSSRSISLSLDNTVADLTAIMARVGVQAGIQTGGGF